MMKVSIAERISLPAIKQELLDLKEEINWFKLFVTNSQNY